MRNSVILVDQIDQDIAAGHAPWDAVIGATVRRFRPIVLTAAAAVLALIPLDAQRLLRTDGGRDDGRTHRRDAADARFLPALYATWFRVRRPAASAAPAQSQRATRSESHYGVSGA